MLADAVSRGRCRQALVCTLVVCSASMATTESQPRRFDLTRALETYLDGRYDGAVAAVAAVEDLGSSQ